MANGDFKDVVRRKASDKVLRDKAVNIAKTPKYMDIKQVLLLNCLIKIPPHLQINLLKVVVLIMKSNKFSIGRKITQNNY